MADRQREQVNDFIRMRPDQVRAENPFRSFFDEHFESIDRLRHMASGHVRPQHRGGNTRNFGDGS